MNVSTIWITFNAVVKSFANADELQIWIAICDIWIIISLLPTGIARTARGSPELAAEFHRFSHQVDCLHSGVDFGSKCGIDEASHYFAVMKNEMKGIIATSAIMLMKRLLTRRCVVTTDMLILKYLIEIRNWKTNWLKNEMIEMWCK